MTSGVSGVAAVFTVRTEVIGLSHRPAATTLDKAGLSATEIADYLGHENPSMTQDVYMNTIKGSKRAAEVMEQRLSGLF
ncbi:hypothetical protein [Homoserinimonas sp. A520]